MEITIFKFTRVQRNQIMRLLTSAIKRVIYSEKDIEELVARIDIFIKHTELDVHGLIVAGRYKTHPNWVAMQLAERFESLLGISVTPTKGREYSQILSICLEYSKAIKIGTNIHRYAAAGIKAISVDKRNPYKLLTQTEKSIVEAADNAEMIKKRKLTERRKKGGQVTNCFN